MLIHIASLQEDEKISAKALEKLLKKTISSPKAASTIFGATGLAALAAKDKMENENASQDSPIA